MMFVVMRKNGKGIGFGIGEIMSLVWDSLNLRFLLDF